MIQVEPETSEIERQYLINVSVHLMFIQRKYFYYNILEIPD